MDQDQAPELGGRLPERIQARLVQVGGTHRAGDLHPHHPQLLHGVMQLLGGVMGALERDRSQGQEPVRVTGGLLGQDLVEPARVGGAGGRLHAVGGQVDPAGEQLHIDPRGVHAGEAGVDVAQDPSQGPDPLAAGQDHGRSSLAFLHLEPEPAALATQQFEQPFGDAVGVDVVGGHGVSYLTRRRRSSRPRARGWGRGCRPPR